MSPGGRRKQSTIQYNIGMTATNYDKTAWDKRLEILGGGILQSSAWADFQQTIDRPAVRDSGGNWAWQGFIRHSRGLNYVIVPYGPVVHSGASEALQSALRAARERGADFVRLEPTGMVTPGDIQTLGGRQIKEVQPQHTFVLDLTPDEADLKAGLESGHRNRVNGTAKRGIMIEQVRDMSPIDDFLRLMADTAQHAGITNYPDWYYRSLAEVLIAKGVASFYVSRVEGQVASVSLIYDWGGVRNYAHTGNDQQLNRHYKVAVSACWQMILDAKAAELKRFDFWGAAPDDSADHAWAGITSFKRAFGGERVQTLGTWDIPIKQTKYRAYEVYRKLRGFK